MRMIARGSRASLSVLGLLTLGWVGALSAEPVPEFYGFYAVDGGKLHEFGKTQDKVEGDFSPGVRFILFDKRVALAPADPSLYRLKFIRYLREPADPADFNGGMCVVKEHKLWMRSEDKERQLELRSKPMPGQTEMVMFVPREPLKPGAYLVAEDDHAYGYLFVGRNDLFANLEASADCVDASRRTQGGIAAMFQQFGGWHDEVPCSQSNMKPGTKDRCQGPTARSTVASTAGASGGAPAAASGTGVAGTWTGRIEISIMGYYATLAISSTTAGQPAGQSEYRSPPTAGSRLLCRGMLTFTAQEGDQYTFEEKITENHGSCPGGGVLRVALPTPGSLDAKWFRPDNMEKPRAKGVLAAR